MKGMAATPFAIFAVTILFMLFMIPLDAIPQESKVDVKAAESSTLKAKNFESTMRNGIGLTASNYIEKSNRYVVDNGFVSDAESAVDLSSGSFDGNSLSYVDFSDWSSGIESSIEDRGNSLEFTVNNPSIVSTGIELAASADVDYEITYDSSSITHDYNGAMQGFSYLRGPDPLLENASGGSFAPDYRYCGFDTPAELLGTGTSGSGDISHGYAAVEPGSLSSVDTSNSRILVVESAAKYSSSELDPFSGVVAEDGTVPSGSYSVTRGLELNVSDGESLIVDDVDVWRSHFRTIMDEQCYVSNSNAPGVYERMEGSFSSSSSGLTTFVDSSSASGTTNEAYIFHDSSSVSPVNISGVTKGDYGNFRSYFMLSDDSGDDNIAEWGIADLVN